MTDFNFGSWQVSAAPACGGNLSKVCWRGNDIMRAFYDVKEWEAAPTNYGFAVLFPPNRIDNGVFDFEGKRYSLPVNEAVRGNHLHGIALREAWELTEVTDNSLCMQFIYDERHSMFSGFPFKCKMSVVYTFSENSLEQRFIVENLSETNMPCALGFHSAFAMPKKLNVHGVGERIELLPPRYLATGRNVPWTDGFEPNVQCNPAEVWPFGHLKAAEEPSAELEYDNFSVKYLPDRKFGYFMVWRKDDEFDYICVEPMNIKIGTFENAPETLPVLRAGEKECFVSKVEITGDVL